LKQTLLKVLWRRKTRNSL